ncbi:Zuotin [Venturia nashicola]|nr:Zuotin [Venturia nashicola]
MRFLAAILCSITYASTAYARPDGSDISAVKSGPHVESSHSESPSLVVPAAPSSAPWNLGGGGAASHSNSSLSPANPSASSPGKSTGSGSLTFEVPPPNTEDANSNLLGLLEEGLLQTHNTRDSKAWPAPSLVPAAPPVPATTPEIYEVPEGNEPQPKIVKGVPPLPMAMVHSEAALDGPHTMKAGDPILTAGVDPLATPLVLGMGAGGAAPLAPLRPTRVVPAVQGATFAAGGTTYTASIDKDFNIVVASNILKPGGAAATLAGGAAKVSVLPGGALVVDGGTLTMSALYPPVTGCVVNINGRLVTARETGTDHQMMVLSTATLTVGGPAVTLDGQQVSLGPSGLHIGPSSVAAISTMTPSLPQITPTPTDPLDYLSSLAKATQSTNGGARPTITVVSDKTGDGTRPFLLGKNMVISLGVTMAILFFGG